MKEGYREGGFFDSPLSIKILALPTRAREEERQKEKMGWPREESRVMPAGLTAKLQRCRGPGLPRMLICLRKKTWLGLRGAH